MTEHSKMIVDGEIEVCDTCVNSLGYPVAWELANHDEIEELIAIARSVPQFERRRAAWLKVNDTLDRYGDGPEYRAAWAELEAILKETP